MEREKYMQKDMVLPSRKPLIRGIQSIKDF